MIKDHSRAVALVTGASSGIGLSVAQKLIKSGLTVYGAARRPFALEGGAYVQMDVLDGDSIDRAIEEIQKNEGRLDVLVNCAGMGVAGACEYTPPSASKAQMDVNFLGLNEVCRRAVPLMRRTGGGKIINLGSVAAAFPIPFQAFYSASKAAIESYSGALRNELRPFGIWVACVHPGDIRTGFTQSRSIYTNGDTVYGGVDERSIKRMEEDEKNGMAPDVCAKAVYSLIKKKRPGPVCVVGAQYKLLCAMKRALPQRLVSFLLYKMYCPKQM